MRVRILSLAVLLALVAVDVRPAEAGILESIKSIFSKGVEKVKSLFGGKKSDTSSDITAFLDKLEQSQATVQERQVAVKTLYDQAGGTLDARNASLQEGLDALETASRENEQLYLQFLKARSAVSEADQKTLADRLTRVTTTQHNIEQASQQLAALNRGSGVYTPPAGGAGEIFNDPKAQKFIDEWLAGCGLDEYARWVSPANADAAGPPDLNGKTRYAWVWEQVADRTAGSNPTLRAYVMARLRGEAISLTALQGGLSDATVVAGTDGTPTGTADPGATGTGGGTASLPAADVEKTVAEIDASLKVAMKRFQEISADPEQAQGAEARSLLDTIKALKDRKAELIKLAAGGN